MRRTVFGIAVFGALAFACEDETPSASPGVPEGDPFGLDGGLAQADGSVGTDSGSPDGGGNFPGDGAVAPEVISAYVSCPNGNDTNAGTEAAPLKTLAKAASVATAGTTIVVLDGTCSKDTETAFDTANGKVTLPSGVSIRAKNPGAVLFTGVDGYRSACIHFAGSGKISGVRSELFGNAITATSGEVTVEGVTFDDVYQGYPITAGGTAKVTVKPGAGDQLRGHEPASLRARARDRGGHADRRHDPRREDDEHLGRRAVRGSGLG